MIHWFKKRGRKSVMLLGVPLLVLAFVLLNTAGSTQSLEQTENSDDGMGKAYEEVFSAVNPADPSDVYIQWDMPKSITTEGQYDSACTNWFLGAYKSDSESLLVALNRSVLSNDVVCALHYFDSSNFSLYMDLLSANGAVVAENLYGNLITGGDEEMVLSLDVPLTYFLDAAVIQLRSGAEEASALSEVYESRLYVGGYASSLVAVQESCNSESEHDPDANESGVVAGSYDAALSKGTGATIPNLIPESENSGLSLSEIENCRSKIGNIFYIDQSIGSDQFSGRSSVVSGNDGPKRTVQNGLAAAGAGNATLVIKSGAYHEDLDIKDRDVQVIVSGDVRL